jgi:hypothetical protein
MRQAKEGTPPQRAKTPSPHRRKTAPMYPLAHGYAAARPAHRRTCPGGTAAPRHHRPPPSHAQLCKAQATVAQPHPPTPSPTPSPVHGRTTDAAKTTPGDRQRDRPNDGPTPSDGRVEARRSSSHQAPATATRTPPTRATMARSKPSPMTERPAGARIHAQQRAGRSLPLHPSMAADPTDATVQVQVQPTAQTSCMLPDPMVRNIEALGELHRVAPIITLDVRFALACSEPI